MVHKQWLKVRFLTSQMPILSGRINFIPHSTTSKKNFLRIPMKYGKNGQKFAMSKNVSNMLFETYWTPCKKPHLSTRSWSWYTFFWMTRYIFFIWFWSRLWRHAHTVAFSKWHHLVLTFDALIFDLHVASIPKSAVIADSAQWLHAHRAFRQSIALTRHCNGGGGVGSEAWR